MTTIESTPWHTAYRSIDPRVLHREDDGRTLVVRCVEQSTKCRFTAEFMPSSGSPPLPDDRELIHATITADEGDELVLHLDALNGTYTYKLVRLQPTNNIFDYAVGFWARLSH